MNCITIQITIHCHTQERQDLIGIVKYLGEESVGLIDRLANNNMKANPDKLQAIAIENR